MALLSRIHGMIRSCFSSGPEKMPAAKVPVRSPAVLPYVGQTGLRQQARTDGQSGHARQYQLLNQHYRQAPGIAKPGKDSVTGTAANRSALIAPKKDSLGAWHQSLEKKLRGLSEQENALRFDAITNQSQPGDGARLTAVRSAYTEHIKLLDESIRIGQEKMQSYRQLQSRGVVLTRAQKHELADLDKAVLELRLTRVRQPVDKR